MFAIPRVIDRVFSAWPEVGETFLSLAIFVNGYDSFRRDDQGSAAAYWVGATLVLLASSAWAFYSHRWFGGVALVVILVAEVWLILHWELKDVG
jgi:uncharacterized membrane protein (UPF0136 family)